MTAFQAAGRPARIVILAALVVAAALPVAARGAGVPIAGKRLFLKTRKGPDKQVAEFIAKGELGNLSASHDPRVAASYLAFVSPGASGDTTGRIDLDPALWKVLGKETNPRGYRYKDPSASRGGIREVILKPDRLVVRAKGASWGFQPSGPQDSVWVHFGIDDESVCAEFGGKVKRNEAGLFEAVDAPRPDTCSEEDSDADGIADHADAYPLDRGCWAASDGDGEDCLATVLAEEPARTIVGDDEGRLYILLADERRVLRFDGVSGHFLPAVDLAGTGTARVMAVSTAHDRLYLGYDDGAITYIDLTNPGLGEQPFASTAEAVGGLASVGNFVLAQDDSGAWESHYLFDQAGNQTDWVEWNHYSRVYAWNEAIGRVYFFRDTSYPNDLMWEDVDQATGEISADGESPYHGDFPIAPPLIVAEDGRSVLLGSGDIYDANTLEVAGSIPSGLTHGLWPLSMGPITLSPWGGDQTLLERRDDERRVVEFLSYDGSPIGLFAAGEAFIVVVATSTEWRFIEYVPRGDSDEDGVANADDAFPLDPAASQDSDHDGYPDGWNPGMGPGDSTQGLVLDAFPLDSACQLPEHALPGQPGVCDIANGIPDYTPDEVVVDDAGVIHLLSTANDRIYRWSTSEDYHLNPLFVDDAPRRLAYSSAHQRLYVGYDSGAITQLDPADPGLGEQPFAATAEAVGGLASVGNFLLAQDDSGAWESHYLFDQAGNQTDWVEWNQYSRVYAWNQALGRVYFFRDTTSPNDLMWEDVDQVTGTITAEGETPYHGSYSIQPPIRVSQDGARVLLGSGDLYDGLTLQIVDSLPIAMEDAVWLADGSVVTIRDNGDGRTRLEQWGTDLMLYNYQYYDGSPLRVVTAGAGIVVITMQAGQPSFADYVPAGP